MSFKYIALVCGVSALFLYSWKSGGSLIYFPEAMTMKDQPLEISAKVYSSEESREILRTDLVTEGFVPVEVTIQNPTDHAYAISAASTAMNSAKPKEIAWKLTKKAIPRGVGLKILSLLFWPFTVMAPASPSGRVAKHSFFANGLKNSSIRILS